MFGAAQSREGLAVLKVLIAIDGSLSSRQALEFAGDMLATREASITIMHVIAQHLVYGKAGAVPTEMYDIAQACDASNHLLDESIQRLRSLGIGPAIEKQIVIGDPAEEIVSVAAEDATDLIIIGSRGLNTAQRLLLGSVSHKVAAHAPCPVLIVRPKGGAPPSAS